MCGTIVGDVFAASGAGRTQPSAGAPGGGLFEEPLDESAFFSDKRGRGFFASPGACPLHGRGAPPACRPRIAEAVRGALGLNPVIKAILRLCSYDFESQIGVDMLGRIFERSVTDLEVLLGRRAVARKEGGIFYTPSYVRHGHNVFGVSPVRFSSKCNTNYKKHCFLTLKMICRSGG